VELPRPWEVIAEVVVWAIIVGAGVVLRRPVAAVLVALGGYLQYATKVIDARASTPTVALVSPVVGTLGLVLLAVGTLLMIRAILTELRGNGV
jgi:hypothetical protein